MVSVISWSTGGWGTKLGRLLLTTNANGTTGGNVVMILIRELCGRCYPNVDSMCGSFLIFLSVKLSSVLVREMLINVKQIPK